MSDEDPWKKEYDSHMVAVQNMSANGFWPVVALACELIDKGLIDRPNLLRITEAIIGYVSAEETGSLGDVEETVLPLTKFLDAIETLPLEPGRVLDELLAQEAAAGAKATQRVRNSKRAR